MSVTGATSLIISDMLKNKIMHGHFYQGVEESIAVPAIADFVYEYAQAMSLYSVLPSSARSIGGKTLALLFTEWAASMAGFRGFHLMEDGKEDLVVALIDDFLTRPYVVPMLPGVAKPGSIGQNAYV